jgi:iron(II)-dependent oxidoreductase
MRVTIKAAIIGAVIAGLFAILAVVVGVLLSKPPKPPELVAMLPPVDSDMKMVLIAAGGFWMGLSEIEIKQLVNEHPDWKFEWLSNETPQRRVCLDSFYIGKYEITNAQYERMLEDNPDYEEPPYWNHEKFNAPNQPVVGVSWNDAVAYCNWLSEKTKRKYGLPTEAQWEKAARGDDGRTFPWGNTEPDIRKANFMQQVGGTMAVGNKPGGMNPVYVTLDMAGNVAEWCGDWYNEDYYRTSVEAENPSGPLLGNEKVVRGGSWQDGAFFLRCTARNKFSPDTKREIIGFRVARLPSN